MAKQAPGEGGGRCALLEPGGLERCFVHPLEAERGLVFQEGRSWVEEVCRIQCAGDCHGNQRETPRGGKQAGTGEGKQETCSEMINPASREEQRV